MGLDKLDETLGVLRELLGILREHGASRFECPDFSVELGGSAPVKESSEALAPVGQLIRVRPAADRPARGIYDHPSLWPGGEPPSFPSKKAV